MLQAELTMQQAVKRLKDDVARIISGPEEKYFSKGELVLIYLTTARESHPGIDAYL